MVSTCIQYVYVFHSYVLYLDYDTRRIILGQSIVVVEINSVMSSDIVTVCRNYSNREAQAPLSTTGDAPGNV